MTAPARAHAPYVAEVEIGRQLVELIRAQITPDDPHYDEIVASECDVVDRMKRLIRAAREKEVMVKAMREMEHDLKERRTRFEEAALTLRAQVVWGMSELGLKRLVAPDFNVSLSPGKPSVKVLNEALLPDDLCRFKREPNLPEIRAHLESGGRLEGATLGNPVPVLRVMVR
jgi:hypothetical protein